MKLKVAIWGTIGTVLLGCGSENGSQNGSILPYNEAENIELAFSRNIWIAERDQHLGNYEYESLFSSFNGYVAKTTIFVENNSVYRRTFESFDGDDTPLQQYDERGANLGKNESGHAPVTIDYLYSICGDILNTTNPIENHITFSVSDVGIMQVCAYFPKNCADDCSTGVHISKLKFE